jgi:hypothetical protein
VAPGVARSRRGLLQPLPPSDGPGRGPGREREAHLTSGSRRSRSLGAEGGSPRCSSSGHALAVRSGGGGLEGGQGVAGVGGRVIYGCQEEGAGIKCRRQTRAVLRPVQ